MTDGPPAPPSPVSTWGSPPIGAVLCGGRSSRFGSDKALAPFRSSLVGARVVAALRGAGIDPVVAIGGTAGDSLGLPTVADRWPGDGPLAALATALAWARRGWVLVVPCDLPLLETAHLERLLIPGPPDEGRAVVATIDGAPKVSLAIWPADRGRTVLRLVEAGERRFRAALDEIGWQGVEVPAAAVADADTPEELAELEAGGI